MAYCTRSVFITTLILFDVSSKDVYSIAMCFTFNQFTANIWYILRSGCRKWSGVELFESLNRKYHVKIWWNLEYFSVENILPKEFDKLTNVYFQLHPHGNCTLCFRLKEQSFAHYLIYIFTWKAAKICTLDDPESHCKREAYEGSYEKKHFPKSANKHWKSSRNR
jgi:hypothetical protein